MLSKGCVIDAPPLTEGTPSVGDVFAHFLAFFLDPVNTPSAEAPPLGTRKIRSVFGPKKASSEGTGVDRGVLKSKLPTRAKTVGGSQVDRTTGGTPLSGGPPSEIARGHAPWRAFEKPNAPPKAQLSAAREKLRKQAPQKPVQPKM